MTATIGTSNASFSDSARGINPGMSMSTGPVQVYTQSIGDDWTRYLPDGTCFDRVGQHMHYGNRYRDSYVNVASQNGFSVASSEEVDKPFSIGGSTLAIEPQAQPMQLYLRTVR